MRPSREAFYTCRLGDIATIAFVCLGTHLHAQPFPTTMKLGTKQSTTPLLPSELRLDTVLLPQSDMPLYRGVAPLSTYRLVHLVTATLATSGIDLRS